MIKKISALTLALVLGVASPAAALRTMNDPNVGGLMYPSCSGPMLLGSYNLDNPSKSGVQDFGDLRVYRGRCLTSATATGWWGVWTSARRADGGAINVRMTVGNYTVSKWQSGTDWNTSPVLESATANWKPSAGSSIGELVYY